MTYHTRDAVLGNTWRLLLSCLVGGFVLGCSLLNDPDPPRAQDAGFDAEPPSMDAGPDAGPEVVGVPPAVLDSGRDGPVEPFPADTGPPDAPSHDGGADVGPPEAGPDGYPGDAPLDAQADAELDAALPPEDCRQVGDEDENGLADCADFACSGHEKCCDEGTEDFSEQWSTGVTDRWNAVPSAGRLTPPRIEDGQIVEFGDEGNPGAWIRAACTPMALGVQVKATLRATGTDGSSCEEPPGCHAGLVLTAALDAQPGQSLAEDLGVRLTHEGNIQVTVAGDVVASSSGPYAADHELLVAVTITPIAESGERLRADVTVTDNTDASDPELVLEGFEFLAQKGLISHVQGCEQVPGLMVAIEGRGDAVQAGDVEATTKRCINPSLFHATEPAQPEAETLTASRLGFGPWASGHLAAPSLLHSPASGGQRWDVMAEASNAAWELETWTHVGYALGHAYASNWDDDPWSGESGPAAGNDPPSCIGQDPGCPQGTSLREPGMFGEVGGGELQFIHVVYARQATTSAPFRYAIHGDTITPSQAVSESTAPILTVDDLEDSGVSCDSLRDPVLAPRGATVLEDGFWLFFTCAQDNRPSSIYAARLQYNLTSRGEVSPVLSPEKLGDYAAGGVWGPEVMVAHNTDDEEAIFRIWFVARSRTGSSTVVAMAQGQAEATSLPETFVPYEANPVLQANSPSLVPGQGACTLTGLAVTPYSDDPARLRMLVARRCLDQDTALSELIPVEQYWKLPWL